MLILYGTYSLSYWRRVSSIGGIGATGGLWPLGPADSKPLALPRRRAPISTGAPTSEELGVLEHYGLDAGSDRVDLLVGSQEDRRLLRGVRCLSCSVPLPARSIHPVLVHGKRLKDVYACSPELTIMQLASPSHSLSLVELMRLVMELCGLYRMVGGNARYKCQPLMSTGSLKAYACRAHGVFGRGRTQQVAGLAMDNSGSPAETDLAIALSLPWRYGGSSLGKPQLNKVVELNELATSILGRDTITPDMLFDGPTAPAIAYPVEYESARLHSEAEQSAYDMRRRNAYAAMGAGCTLIHKSQIHDHRGFDAIAETIRRNIGRRSSAIPADYAQRHAQLLDEALASWLSGAGDGPEGLRW